MYRVTPQTDPESKETFDVTNFAALLEQERRSVSDDACLVLFSGDVFSPSVESTVTRGSHMVPVMNFLRVDAACTGAVFSFAGATKDIDSH